MAWWLALWLVLPLFAPSAPSRATGPDDPLFALGRSFTAQFDRGETVQVWERMTPQMQKALGSAAALALFSAQVLRDAGEETALVSERRESAGGYDTYVRIARRARAPMPVVVSWTFDAERRIAGFLVQPLPQPAPTSKLDYQTHARLWLPFDGEWFVYWGGRTLEHNYHVVAQDQRFAYDFVVRKDGRAHSGTGTRAEDYFCWDRVVRAPADATIVAAVDQYPDNAPGATDPAHPAGNHVILDLGGGEYALLGHLRRGSVRGKHGDRVDAGAEIGRCGNSGNTTEPHLHFHLQDSPHLGDGHGLPAFFVDYVAHGKAVKRGEPTRGQIVAPARQATAGTRAAQ